MKWIWVSVLRKCDKQTVFFYRPYQVLMNGAEKDINGQATDEIMVTPEGVVRN